MWLKCLVRAGQQNALGGPPECWVCTCCPLPVRFVFVCDFVVPAASAALWSPPEFPQVSLHASIAAVIPKLRVIEKGTELQAGRLETRVSVDSCSFI